jgi:erythronate-4-phosphate dehydrogenase
MKIVADENIPYVEELFGVFGSISCLPGRAISSHDLRDADVLLIRSVTKVDEALLHETKVGFVGTCTIGTDHVDLNFLKEKGVSFASAPGCNARAVVQYVVCALSELGTLQAGKRAVVIGCGNVGSQVYKALSAIGLDCLGVDPFLTHPGDMSLSSIEAIYDADIICMHTPLTEAGPHPTKSLIDSPKLKELKPGTLLLNAGRGECISNTDLLQYLKWNEKLKVVLDVWENEPEISLELANYVSLATPHIAGYSHEGKLNGATMIFSELGAFLGNDRSWIKEKVIDFRDQYFGAPIELKYTNRKNCLRQVYDVRRDHQRLLSLRSETSLSFDQLRKEYPMRREFSHYQLRADDPNSNTHSDFKVLSSLGFGIENAS